MYSVCQILLARNLSLNGLQWHGKEDYHGLTTVLSMIYNEGHSENFWAVDTSFKIPKLFTIASQLSSRNQQIFLRWMVSRILKLNHIIPVLAIFHNHEKFLWHKILLLCIDIICLRVQTASVPDQPSTSHSLTSSPPVKSCPRLHVYLATDRYVVVPIG